MPRQARKQSPKLRIPTDYRFLRHEEVAERLGVNMGAFRELKKVAHQEMMARGMVGKMVLRGMVRDAMRDTLGKIEEVVEVAKVKYLVPKTKTVAYGMPPDLDELLIALVKYIDLAAKREQSRKVTRMKSEASTPSESLEGGREDGIGLYLEYSQRVVREREKDGFVICIEYF